jgi:hypothetical protein
MKKSKPAPKSNAKPKPVKNDLGLPFTAPGYGKRKK